MYGVRSFDSHLESSSCLDQSFLLGSEFIFLRSVSPSMARQYPYLNTEQVSDALG